MASNPRTYGSGKQRANTVVHRFVLGKFATTAAAERSVPLNSTGPAATIVLVFTPLQGLLHANDARFDRIGRPGSAGRPGPLVGEGGLHGVPGCARSGLLGELRADELPLFLRHRPL